jgi:hypothetical protein
MPQKESALSAATGEHPLVGRGTISLAQPFQGVQRYVRKSDGKRLLIFRSGYTTLVPYRQSRLSDYQHTISAFASLAYPTKIELH